MARTRKGVVSIKFVHGSLEVSGSLVVAAPGLIVHRSYDFFTADPIKPVRWNVSHVASGLAVLGAGVFDNYPLKAQALHAAEALAGVTDWEQTDYSRAERLQMENDIIFVLSELQREAWENGTQPTS